jgi:DNA-binding MarR family transcriptional regulator
MTDHIPLPLDAETAALEAGHAHQDELRLWLRLLTCTNMIEGQIRSRLRAEFDVTLPRFDLMAQLYRAPDGMMMSEVSKRMMVSSGNVTLIVDHLLASGDVERQTSAHDRRAQLIRLTEAGRRNFRQMASVHEAWIAGMFDGLTKKDMASLMKLLAKTKSSLQADLSQHQQAAAPSAKTPSPSKKTSSRRPR